MRRRALLAGLPLALAACAPATQRALAAPPPGFGGPALLDDRFVSFDGAALGLTTWAAEGEPWAVIVGLHGMDDYANAFHMAAPFWAKQGFTTYAFDQRGFGRSPRRGVWAGEDLLSEDCAPPAPWSAAGIPRRSWRWPARAWAGPPPSAPSPRTARPTPTA